MKSGYILLVICIFILFIGTIKSCLEKKNTNKILFQINYYYTCYSKKNAVSTILF